MRVFLFVVVLFAAACGGGPDRPASIGEGYAGPATLNIRKDIPLQSPTVATVKHGERLEIVQRRRRFLKVRTPSGAEGWTDERQLLSSEEMNRLRELNRRARGLLSQGLASTYDKLNVHTEPSRFSPSFTAINAGDKVDVLDHEITPRVEVPRPPLIPPAPKRTRPAKKKKESRIPPPPFPAPPPLAANWLEMSKTPPSLPVEPEPQRVVPTDDWTLIRTHSGQSGWVLTRRLYMAIPDEVAQYAEGRRITSYFSLGEVRDGDQVKHNWVWTTAGAETAPYDFDSFRVFIWNVRRHRYETAYIERKVRGFAPVRTHPVQISTGNRSRTGEPVMATYPGFSICMEKDDGHRHLRNYAFIVNVVRFAGEETCDPQAQPGGESKPVPPLVAANSPGSEDRAEGSLLGRFKQRLRDLGRRWFGR